MKKNKIYQGECLEVLKTFPDESIDCVMTSPPYWALRDYGVEGQLGLEPTFQEYINKLCDIFEEIKRVLKKTGTCWVNLGDTYNAGGNFRGKELDDGSKEVYSRKDFAGCQMDKEAQGISAKCLCQIPSRFAIEMTNRGWILRNEIIWHKKNAMPSSVSDRFTVDFEKIFFFTKNKKYWFEQQREAVKLNSINRAKHSWDCDRANNKGGVHTKEMGNRFVNPEGRNKRCVWQINPKPYKEAHFAVYPEKLCETPLKAGCPEFVCKKCGFVREKVIDRVGGSPSTIKERKQKIKMNAGVNIRKGGEYSTEQFNISGRVSEYKFKGYTSCECNAGFEGGIVLDPFFGSGTTGLVALKQSKQFIGIELNPEYIKIAEKRLKGWINQSKLNNY
tara:strand:- start:50 stop:1216 length:1167 start_codon:yes stop_codon:yes gene_type:complete